MEDLRSSWEWMLNLEVLLIFDIIQSHPYFVPDITYALTEKKDLTSRYSRNSKTW